MTIKRFGLWATGITSIIAGIYTLLVSTNTLDRASFDVAILLTVYAIALLSYILVLFVKNLDASYFFYAILGSFVIRLLLFAGVNFFIIYLDRDQAVSNVILFFIIYLFLTVLETVGLFTLIRQSDTSNTQ